MSTIPFPGHPRGAPVPPAPVPAIDENAAAISRFIDIRCVARGLNESSRHARRLILKRFLRYCGRPLWQVTPHDYDSYIAHHVLERNLAPSTHRYYQSTIDCFFSYLDQDLEYQGYLQKTYGVRLENPLCDDNRIIHKAAVQHKRPHYGLTREEIDALFHGMAKLRDAYARENSTASARSALRVERDRIAFGIQYYIALRVSEVCHLDLDSFEEAPWARELMGRFGMVRVVGKGMPLQGPKSRMVPVTTHSVRALIEWYLKHVRPMFPNAKTSKALFLTLEGTRVSRSTLIHNLKEYLVAAGLDPTLFTTHSLRRSGITHDVERMDMAFGQIKAGHEWQATTQIYVARPEEYVQEQANRLLRQTIKTVTGRPRVPSIPKPRAPRVTKP